MSLVIARNADFDRCASQVQTVIDWSAAQAIAYPQPAVRQSVQ